MASQGIIAFGLPSDDLVGRLVDWLASMGFTQRDPEPDEIAPEGVVLSVDEGTRTFCLPARAPILA